LLNPPPTDAATFYGSRRSAGSVYAGYVCDAEHIDVNYKSTCQIALQKQAFAINMSISTIL